MSYWRRLAQDTDGGPAAEFALVLPVALLFLLGIIDVGRYMWEVNRAEKATQIGARYAAATDMVASGLASYSFAAQASGAIPAGTTVPVADFPGVDCSSDGSTTTCTCATGGTCAFPLTANSAAFNAMVARMDDIKKDITPAKVLITYSYSGLGFAGDPNGPDVAPIITVKLRNMQFTPLTGLLFRARLDLPDFSYALTMEDGSGTVSN
jgi:Flp pilus assembly protein TadG